MLSTIVAALIVLLLITLLVGIGWCMGYCSGVRAAQHADEVVAKADEAMNKVKPIRNENV